jgi:hypothetical protein
MTRCKHCAKRCGLRKQASQALAIQTQYSVSMKTAVIPQVRVDPGLRAQLEAVLQPDETLSEFVEASVRRAVEERQAQTQFQERGQVAWENYRRSGVAVPAEQVLGKLQARLDARRRQLGG